MKANEVRERTTEELETLRSDLRRELFKTRIQNHTNQLDSTAKLRSLRRDISRIATVIRERELKG